MQQIALKTLFDFYFEPNNQINIQALNRFKTDNIGTLSRNEYQNRIQLFNEIFYEDQIQNINGHDPQDPQPQVINIDTKIINRLESPAFNNLNMFGPAKRALAQMAVPSLVQYKFFFLPPLVYNLEEVERFQMQNNNNIQIFLQELQELNIVNGNTTIPISTIKPGNELGAGAIKNKHSQYFSRIVLQNVVRSILNMFINERVEQVFLNLEILYSDFPFVQLNILNQQNHQDFQNKLIAYQRAFGIIDMIILNNPEQQQAIEQQYFHRMDEIEQNTFILEEDHNADINQNADIIYWRKMNFNFQFRIQAPLGLELPENHKIMYIENNIDIEIQLQDILKNIYLHFEQLDGYATAIYPTFIRYFDLYAIKRFTGIPNNDNPQIFHQQNNTIDLLQDFLNGMIAFDYDKGNPINEYDVIKNININYHCLLRIVYYFTNLEQPTDPELFMVEMAELQNIRENIDINQNPLYGLFLGSVKHLHKYIQKRFNIILNVFCYKSTKILNPKQLNNEYILIINKNHCVLSTNQLIEPLLQKKNNKQYYKMIGENQPNKTKLSKQNLKYKQKMDQRKEWQIKNYFIDFETYVLENDKGVQGVFLICLLDDNLNKIHFSDLNCLQEFIEYLDKLIIQYNELQIIINIWSFNGGKFDYMFLIPHLINKYYDQLYIIGTELDIKQINIGNVYFKDIYYIFNRGSLKQQAINWGIEYQKQEFDIKGWTLDMYRDPFKQQKVIEYCYQDCLVLKGLVDKFFNLLNNEFQNNKFNINKVKYDISKIYSASTLTMIIFKDFYLKYELISSKNRLIYQIERDSYFGGVTQNFKKQGQNLYYYDINSSYPNVMKNNKIPIQPASQWNEKIYEINQVYGAILTENNTNISRHTIIDTNLYEVELKFKQNVQITTLPTRTSDGLIYLRDIQKSWRWGCELNLIFKNYLDIEYKITRVIVYKAEIIFDNFINDLYEKRQQAKKDKRSDLDDFYKILMNSGYGKFGQKQYPQTQFVKIQDIEEHLRNPLLTNIKKMKYNLYKLESARNNNLNFQGALVRIASFITAQARCNLFEGMIKVGMGNVYYCDTDSIMVSKQLPQQMIGDKLGQWKLECQIKDGLFIAPKVYYIKFDQLVGGKSEVMKCKGVNKNSLNSNIFNQLKNVKMCKVINKDVFKREFGSVAINNQVKYIRVKDLKRLWTNDNYSIPYQTIDKYEEDKLIKDDINQEIFVIQRLKKLFNDELKIQQKMQQIFKKKYQQIINDDNQINQKRKAIIQQQGEIEYIKNKCILK